MQQSNNQERIKTLEAENAELEKRLERHERLKKLEAKNAKLEKLLKHALKQKIEKKVTFCSVVKVHQYFI